MSKTAKKTEQDHLVTVTKGGETIAVHPSCVADHRRCGWSLVSVEDSHIPPQPTNPES